MNRSKGFVLLFFAIVLVLPWLMPSPAQPADAQGKSCAQVVDSALTYIEKSCSRTGRNKACYGNVLVNAVAQSDAANLKFSKPGDVADVKAIKTLQLGPMVVDSSTWGLAVLRIQANLPDTAVGQNVTMLLFGDVSVQDASRPGATAPGLATAAATLAATVAATATKSAVRPTPTATLPPSKLKPMQAFYFRGGIGESACAEAPQDGILIQSPQGKQKVELDVNEVHIVLGSTLFLQAQPGQDLIVHTLEGSADVTAFGKTETAAAGTRVRVPIDNFLRASGPPNPPESYDSRNLWRLPLRGLPQSVGIKAPPIPANAAYATWHLAELTKNVTGIASCTHAPLVPPSNVTIATDPATGRFWLTGEVFYPTSSTTYVAEYPYADALEHTEINFTSPTHGDIRLIATVPNCTLTSTWSLDFVSTGTAAPPTPTATPKRP